MVYWCWNATPLIAYLFASNCNCSSQLSHTPIFGKKIIIIIFRNTCVYNAHLQPARHVSISILRRKSNTCWNILHRLLTFSCSNPRVKVLISSGWVLIKFATHVLNLYRIILVWVSKYTHESAAQACFANLQSGQNHHYHPGISWDLNYLLFSDCVC